MLNFKKMCKEFDWLYAVVHAVRDRIIDTWFPRAAIEPTRTALRLRVNNLAAPADMRLVIKSNDDFDIGADGTYHSIKGLGTEVFPFSNLDNKVKNSLADLVTTGTRPGSELVAWKQVPQGAAIWSWGRITGLSNIINRSLAGSVAIGDMTGFNGITAPFTVTNSLAGRLVVTITPATFLACKLTPGGRVIPICCSMLTTAWTVNGDWSPVPSRPTTRP